MTHSVVVRSTTNRGASTEIRQKVPARPKHSTTLTAIENTLIGECLDFFFKHSMGEEKDFSLGEKIQTSESLRKYEKTLGITCDERVKCLERYGALTTKRLQEIKKINSLKTKRKADVNQIDLCQTLAHRINPIIDFVDEVILLMGPKLPDYMIQVVKDEIKCDEGRFKTSPHYAKLIEMIRNKLSNDADYKSILRDSRKNREDERSKLEDLAKKSQKTSKRSINQFAPLESNRVKMINLTQRLIENLNVEEEVESEAVETFTASLLVGDFESKVRNLSFEHLNEALGISVDADDLEALCTLKEYQLRLALLELEDKDV